MYLSSEPLGILVKESDDTEVFLDVFKPAFSSSEEECKKEGYLWVSSLCFKVPLYRTVAIRKVETNIECEGKVLYLVVAELGEPNRDYWKLDEPEVVEVE